MRTVLWLAGGLSVGAGMVSVALFGFQQPAGDVATSFAIYGYDALPHLTITSFGYTGFLLVAIGAALMIRCNATAWKETGGY